MAELEKEIKEAITSLKTFQEDVDGRLKKHGDVLDKIQSEKLIENVTDFMEKSQKAEQEAKAKEEAAKAEIKTVTDRLAKAEAAISRPPASSDAAEKKAKEAQSAIFNDFMKKADKGDFADFIEGKDDKYFEEKGIERKALSVGSDPDGGYMVTPEFGGMINTRIFETSPIRSLANVVTISSDSIEIVADNDEAGATWTSESGAVSESTTPTFDKIVIPTHELVASPKATTKLLDDAAFNAEQWLSGKVSDKFSRTENTAFIAGNGVGKPMGFLTKAQSSASSTYSATEIEFVPSGTSGAFTADGVINLQGAVKEGYQSNSAFLTKRNNFTAIIKLKDGNQNYLFNRALDKSAGSPFTLLGKRVVFADDIPAVAADALALAYGDFRAAYTIVDRRGVRVLRDPYSNKPFVEFYTTKRVGGGVVNFEAIKLQKLSAS